MRFDALKWLERIDQTTLVINVWCGIQMWQFPRQLRHHRGLLRDGIVTQFWHHYTGIIRLEALKITTKNFSPVSQLPGPDSNLNLSNTKRECQHLSRQVRRFSRLSSECEPQVSTGSNVVSFTGAQNLEISDEEGRTPTPLKGIEQQVF